MQSDRVWLGIRSLTDSIPVRRVKKLLSNIDEAAHAELAFLFRMAIFDWQQNLSWMLTPSLLACSVGLVVSMIQVTSDESLKLAVLGELAHWLSSAI